MALFNNLYSYHTLRLDGVYYRISSPGIESVWSGLYVLTNEHTIVNFCSFKFECVIRLDLR
jgi:hypothetical protein